MRGGRRKAGVVGLLSLLALAGCAGTGQARYVYQDGQYGVIGIPENTCRWPTYYHTQAERLMAEHFPGGYEIVRAEEVVEGSRTLIVGGATSAEIGPGLPAPALRVARLGRTATRKQSDSVKIHECRIVYKRADAPHHDQPALFADRSSLTPTLYVDPNASARKGDGDWGSDEGDAGEKHPAATKSAKAKEKEKPKAEDAEED
jgi:hypothetical protein